MEFNKFKEEALRRAKDAGACEEEYRKQSPRYATAPPTATAGETATATATAAAGVNYIQ